jgi:hypothetical protein
LAPSVSRLSTTFCVSLDDLSVLRVVAEDLVAVAPGSQIIAAFAAWPVLCHLFANHTHLLNCFLHLALQCGKLERIEAFAGTKRSCRLGLNKRRINHAASAARQQQQQRGSTAVQPCSSCAASSSNCSSASLTEMPVGGCSSDTAAAAAAAAAAAVTSMPAAAYAVPQQEMCVPQAFSIEELLWQELHKELQVPASTAAAAAAAAAQPAAALAAAPALLEQQQQQLQLPSGNIAAAAAPAEAVAAAGGFDYSGINYTNEKSLNRLEQMIELEIMQALLQPAAAAAVPAAGAAAQPAAAAAEASRQQRSAALMDQFQAVSAELLQLQAAIAELHGLDGLQQQQQQPGVSLTSSWEAWGV